MELELSFLIMDFFLFFKCKRLLIISKRIDDKAFIYERYQKRDIEIYV